jgi:hypothetical protein
LVSKTASNCAGVLSAMSLSARVPAPWMMAVIGPQAARASASAASTDSGRRTSAAA